MSDAVDGRRLLAWADRDERRRRGRRPSGAAVAAGLAGLGLGVEAAYRCGWFDGARAAPGTGYLVAVALAALIPTMLAAPQRMFWRPDAAMVARMPVAGAALWYVAVMRALRGALLGVVVVAPTLVLTAIVDGALAGRAASLVGALVLAATALVPAVCLGAAHLVASGQAHAATRAMAGDYQLATTTWLGALPGFTIASITIAAIASAGWVTRADPAGLGVLIAIAGVALGAGALATVAAPRIYPRAMREVAALDRQILAHLEIDPVTGLERAVRDRLGAAALPFDRMARLVRRRYPLFALGGAAGGIALIIIAIASPADWLWFAIAAVALAVLALLLHRATGRAPLEAERSSATLPIAPASIARARRALVALWLAVWALVPAAIAAIISVAR